MSVDFLRSLKFKKNDFLSIFRFNLVLFALTFICVKACSCKTAPLHTIGREKRDQQIASTATSDKTDHEQFTTYFRHEPYGTQTYAFGFEVDDIITGNRQFRDERRYANGTVEGSYGYVRPDGRITITHFIATAERGYLSQTRTYEEGDYNIKDQNWRMYFSWEDSEDRNRSSSAEKDELKSKVKKIDYINLEKDLLNPTLEAIINGNLTQTKNKNNGFQNIIPNHFPIVPFELPLKVQKDLKSNENNKSSENEKDENLNIDVASNQTTTSSKFSEHLDEKMKNNFNSKKSDWIASFVNETRKDFLEN